MVFNELNTVAHYIILLARIYLSVDRFAIRVAPLRSSSAYTRVSADK